MMVAWTPGKRANANHSQSEPSSEAGKDRRLLICPSKQHRQEEARMRLGSLLYSEVPVRVSLPVTQGHKGSIRF